ncbi:MAG: hypothetical protein ACFCBU_10295 [Cyanophyceae cyanobacterium]
MRCGALSELIQSSPLALLQKQQKMMRPQIKGAPSKDLRLAARSRTDSGSPNATRYASVEKIQV